jgi:signal transduction histidine kinase
VTTIPSRASRVVAVPPDALPPQAQALLDAVIAISTDLDLRSVLTRIITSASELTGAKYGALGVIGPDGTLVEFITTGLEPHAVEQIGELPRGRGILRLIIDEPQALRLDDLGAHPQASGFPPGHPPMTTFLGVPIRIRGTVFGNLYLTQKEGGAPFTDQDEELVQGLASAAGFVIDNARAYGLSERRRQWLEESAELADALHPPIHLETALARITNGARRVSGAFAAAVVQFPADGDPVISALEGTTAEVLEPLLEDIGGLAEESAEAGYPLDLATPDLTAVSVPLRAHLAEPGVLVMLFDNNHRTHEYEERELLASFADHAGLALDRAQAVVDRQELALVSERDRIARDLHDIVIQRLFATGMKLQGLHAGGGDHDVDGRIDEAINDLDLTIKDIRSTIFALQNKQPMSLRRELRALVKEYVPVLGQTPTLRTMGPVDTVVSDEVKDQVLAVLREAISNVARHALADHTDVELQARDNELVLRVADDGTGLPVDRHESGLRNVRRRASSLGGTLELGANQPRGTVMTWRVPLT